LPENFPLSLRIMMGFLLLIAAFTYAPGGPGTPLRVIPVHWEIEMIGFGRFITVSTYLKAP